MRKIGINLHAVKGLTDEEYLRRIAALGFRATFTGVHDPDRQKAIASLCERFGIACETLHAPYGHINDIWRDKPEGQAMLDELIRCIDHCRIAGASIAVVHLSAGMTPPPVTDIGRRRFTGLVEYAAAKNVRVAFENQRMLSNIAWAFETFPSDLVGFCWDCGHESCFTPGRHYMELFGSRLICTHIHDNTAVFNEDKHLIPFDGACDFESVTASLRQSGFVGSLMLEVGNSSFYANLSPEEFLTRAAEAADRLRRMVDENR